jgi:hypothetical protein
MLYMPQLPRGRGWRVAGWVFVVGAVLLALVLLVVVGDLVAREAASGVVLDGGVTGALAAISALLGRYLLRKGACAATHPRAVIHHGPVALGMAWACFAISAALAFCTAARVRSSLWGVD